VFGGAVALAVMRRFQRDRYATKRRVTLRRPCRVPQVRLSVGFMYVMVRQARDRQFEYLNAQQGAIEDESGDEFWSNPQRGHDLVEMSDWVPLRCDVGTYTVDIEETPMQINITGSANLQREIRLQCAEYIDIFSPTVRQEPARVPPLSMKLDSDKWKENGIGYLHVS
jgi:hypothetical protein